MQHLQTVMGACSVLPDRDIAFQSAMVKMFGPGAAFTSPAEWNKAKNIVIWGCNPTVSCKRMMHLYLDAKDAGAKLTTIDIQYNTNVAKSDWFVPVHPATDGALVFGALSEILAQGWQDTEFLRAHTEAPFLVKDDNKFLRMSDLDVDNVLNRWLLSLSQEKRISELCRLTWSASRIIMNHRIDAPDIPELKYSDNCTVRVGGEDVLLRVAVDIKEGLLFGVGSEELSFMSIWPRPEAGYAAYFADWDLCRRFLSVS